VVDEKQVRTIVEQIVTRLSKEGALQIKSSIGSDSAQSGRDGVYPTIEEAIAAASKAQKILAKSGLDLRRKLVKAVRHKARQEARRMAEEAVKDTNMGSVDHKEIKNLLASDKTPGVEDLATEAVSGDDGLTLSEYAPYGVVGSITPSTNPTATVINHAICMISAGNAVVFNPHPSAAKSTLIAINILHRAIVEAGGPEGILAAPAEPTLRTAKKLMEHPEVDLLVATGGAAVVKACMQSGKRTIGAGPGNPPAVVDETADIQSAAIAIIDGATFDNNMPCICEKEVIVVRAVADTLIEAMVRNGAYLLTDSQTSALVKIVLTEDNHLNKNFVGKDASVIAKEIGVNLSADKKLLIMETNKMHPFVQEELLMPILPIVRVRDFDEAVQVAKEVEHGFRHTALIHSKDMNRVTVFAKIMNVTLLAVNGSCGTVLGYGGEGCAAFTIAGPTGEGITTPRTFTRAHRVAIKNALRTV